MWGRDRREPNSKRCLAKRQQRTRERRWRMELGQMRLMFQVDENQLEL